jgi:hypothetical protein
MILLIYVDKHRSTAARWRRRQLEARCGKRRAASTTHSLHEPKKRSRIHDRQYGACTCFSGCSVRRWQLCATATAADSPGSAATPVSTLPAAAGCFVAAGTHSWRQRLWGTFLSTVHPAERIQSRADIVDSVRRSALHSCTCFVKGQPTQCGGL